MSKGVLKEFHWVVSKRIDEIQDNGISIYLDWAEQKHDYRTYHAYCSMEEKKYDIHTSGTDYDSSPPPEQPDMRFGLCN